MNTLKRLFNPEIFQGVNKNKNYFEGYYFKLVDKEEKHSFAFIPGIAFDKNKSGHSFIQWIDAEIIILNTLDSQKKTLNTQTIDFS